MRLKYVPLLLVALSLAAPVSAEAEVLTNSDVVQLVSLGLGEEAVIAKIRASQKSFDLSTDGLIALKSGGVPNSVIAAMLGVGTTGATSAPSQLSMDSPDPMVPHYPGLYMLDAKGTSGKMTRVNPTVSNQAKTGGIFGYALTAGIASVSIKAAIPGDSAKVQTSNPMPVFFAFFDESIPRDLQIGNSQWASGVGTTTSSPSEVTLVRFMEKKGRREARVGSMNIAGSKTGVMDKDQIAFDSEMLAPGVFKVVPKQPLEPGEYGFIQALNGGGSNGAMTARVFDFG